MENQKIDSSGLRQGQRLILEPGAPPTSEQVPDNYTPETATSTFKKIMAKCINGMAYTVKVFPCGI